MQYFLFILALVFILLFMARLLTVFIHELGHAIPAILLTKEKVTVYIGSYGDPRKSIRLRFKMLEVYIRYNPFTRKPGVCVPAAKNVSLNRQIIYTITGPVASLIIATAACCFVFAYDMHGLLKLFFVIFFGSALADMIINLIPRNKPLELYKGGKVYNDGYKLKQLLRHKKFPKEYSQAVAFYNQQDFLHAAESAEKILAGGTKNKVIYRLSINSYLQCKNYLKAKTLLEEFAEKEPLNSNDLSSLALCHSQLGQHDKAIALYDQSLQQNPDNKYSLNNKGYTLNLLDRFEEAIPLFDKAIEIDKNFAYSYNNRGLAKIKTGQEAEGLKDIHHSFTLDKDNAYGYRNLGIYHFDKGNYEEALQLFIKANELDNTTHMIKELIDEAEQHVNKRAAINKNVDKTEGLPTDDRIS